MSAHLWVTGLGLITPLGAGVEATWSRLVRGDRALRPIRLFDSSGQRANLAGEVADVTITATSRHELAGWSRTSAMAAAAAREAMRAAQLDVARMRVGLVVGSTTGGLFETELLLGALTAQPSFHEGLLQLLSHPLTATGDRLDEQLGPFSRVRTISSACSSGANAIVVAASWLINGELDAVVAGGSDGLCRLTVSGFNALAALDPGPCRPFDRRRRGANLGEGAGFLVLEHAERARSRGARPIAELAGWALGSEAHHITNPAPDGVRVAALIERAIARAGLSPEDVDYVNAHGTGTPLNDAMEAEALRLALGPEAARVPVSSSKAQMGHTLGAAGAIEAAITALVVARRMLVPTAGLDEPDPTLALIHVPHVGRGVARVRAAISNAFGFGGMDTVLVFKEVSEALSRTAPPETAVGAARGQARALAPSARSASPLVVTGAAVFSVCGLLGGIECAGLPHARTAAALPVDPDFHLDATRARRLDRTARLGAVAVQRALSDAASTAAGADEIGVVLGSAFGNVDACAGFLRRIGERGARSASPAEFPNLVPSSPVGHVSIYLGLRGPAFATADLGGSGESAFVQAAQLVAAGEAAQMVAAGAEPISDIVARIFGRLFPHSEARNDVARNDVAAAVVVEGERPARERGARILARVSQIMEWRGDALSAIGSLRPPRSRRAQVVLVRSDGTASAVLARTEWSECDRACCAPALGESAALGIVALAVAAARVGAAHIDEALVLGLAQGRGYAIALARE